MFAVQAYAGDDEHSFASSGPAFHSEVEAKEITSMFEQALPANYPFRR